MRKGSSPETASNNAFGAAVDLVSDLLLDQAAQVDQDHGEGEQWGEGAFGAVVAQREALEAQQPGDGALDDPADPAELGLVLDPAPRDPDLDPASGQVGAAATVVVALVRVQLVWSSSRPARVSATAGTAGLVSSRGSNSMLSWVFAPEISACSGRPFASHSRWYLVACLPRSVGLWPVSSPPFRAHRHRVDARPGPVQNVGVGQFVEHESVQAVPHVGVLPGAQAPPCRVPRAAAQLRW